ncbi:GIY-YIG nuclease family protein [Actomonas aquatica]|uniref:GIY-YIG nuclease family protein n=1 Tax=Actomonas aquatica TaxID=2866162 RepID=A0ABZ1C5W1_9BACT|nr:GIY-YIG nuclease family protein [Opitutus sp. WL0086]WRQ87117.1 GIY-YIG nuclease family protein [Opitutus sp. WL0086]
MHYVYLTQSVVHPEQRYIGLPDNLKTRLNAHNRGQSPHTTRHKPWRLETYLAFSDLAAAREFELYLKSGSGRAFASKRLWSSA